MQFLIPACPNLWLKLGMHDSQLYPTDLSNAQWAELESLLPPPAKRGRPRTPLRSVLNAIFYVLRSGGAWRLLPKDFPPWRTVYGWFWRWRRTGLWQKIHDALRARLRQRQGRHRQPSAAILDSQTVKIADQRGARGYDAGKKIHGRKRHLIVDTLGLVLLVLVTEAGVQDRVAARSLLAGLGHAFSRLVCVWADGGYAGTLVDWLWRLRRQRRVRLQIVNRWEGVAGFRVLPKRWVVERTFGWLMKWRRLRCDYEQLCEHSAAWIQIAMIGLMVRRLARER